MNKNFVKFININEKLYSELIYAQKKDINLKNFTSLDLIKFIKKFKKYLVSKNNIKALILCLYPSRKKKTQLSAVFIKNLSEFMASYIGNMLSQNSNKDKLIEVFDRDRKFSMNKGSRYHQTREGGSIHTDNVNIETKWDYLMFSCLSKAQAGGETILVDAEIINKELSLYYPEAKKVLMKNFYWEKRGVANELYRAPILTFDKNNKPNFRYLRPYLESAHVKAKKRLTSKQLYSLDVLDALLETSKFQFRYKMQKGDILFNLDSKVLHGRTSFSDFLNALPLSKVKKNENNLKRTMIRVWIKEKKN
jgi:hypothetical protein